MSTLVTDPEILKKLAAVPYESEVSNNSNNNDETIPTAVKKELSYSERVNALVQNRAKEVSGTFKKLEDAETQQQKDFLLQNGCHYIQGFYYSKPVIASDIEKQLATTDHIPA